MAVVRYCFVFLYGVTRYIIYAVLMCDLFIIYDAFFLGMFLFQNTSKLLSFPSLSAV